MTNGRTLYRQIRSLHYLRLRLKPHPEHRRKLIFSYARNTIRLMLLKLRLMLVRKKLVIIALGERMGDIVACEPVSRQVRDLHPDAYVLWAVRPAYVELVRDNPQLDGFLPIYCVTDWIWLRKLPLVDHLYDLHINGRHCKTCNEGLLKSDGDPNVDMDTYYNYGTLLGAFSRSAGLPTNDGDPLIFIDARTKEAVDRLHLPERFLTIHTRSEDDIRNWDDDKWKQLIEQIIETHDIPIVEIGLKSFLDRPDDEHYVNLCGKCGLLETAEVIRRSSLFIGIESGPAHLANAVKTPGVLLMLGKYMWFDSYTPHSGFYSDPARCRIIRSEGALADLPVESCLSAIAERLPSLEEIPATAPRHGPN